jgi:suppressor for copper-sensitivity B
MCRLLLIAYLLFLSVFPALAAAPVSISLIPGRYESGAKFAYFGMKITMDQGWHTYWKSPGEGGLPPEMKVTRAQNATGMTMLWPAPSIVRSLGDDIVGYENEVLFPLAVPVKTPGQPVDVSLSVTIYACSNICVPFKQEITSRNEVGSLSSLKASEVEKWVSKVPMKSGTVNGTIDANTGMLKIDAASIGSSEYSQLFLDSGLDYAAAPLYGSKASAVSFVVKPLSNRTPLTELAPPHVVVVDKGIPREYELVLQTAGSSSFGIILTAFIGGLILNLMPCVLPVLSLKLVSFTKDREHVRQSFAWSALGIWTSFMVLGVGILALKATGSAVGWGLQFQSPIFLGVMSVITGLFAVSMVDGLMLYLPGRFADGATKLSMGKGASGSFFQGFVATLLATPCSAPFVGTAAGFAFAASAPSLLLIFCAMGAGMALPYAAIALIPGLQRLVPKPGLWMGAFKTILAMLMAGMSGYLAALVGATFSLNASYILLIALFVVIGLLVRKALLFGLLAVSLFAYPVWDNVSSKETASASVWVKFEPDKIASLVAAGKTVVIDISAKWCITCKINDQTVWNRDDVGKALSGTNVVAMRGDWTRPDPVIADYLKSFNRYGLPFNIVYSPSQTKGVLLPELLSKKDIFDAIGDHAK